MKYDLHIHTAVSDGTASPEIMVRQIKKRGLDGFSVTDHDRIGSVPEYRRLARKFNLIYVSGIEITSANGHILCYCLPERADILTEFKLFQSLDYYLEKAEELNVVLSPAHPFDYFRHGMGHNVFGYTWSCIETFNASTVFPFANRRARRAARILHLPEIGGSDAHTEYCAGLAYTETEASTAEELLNSIKRGKTSVGGKHMNALQFSRRMLESKIFK